jgi:hypothetical protein
MVSVSVCSDGRGWDANDLITPRSIPAAPVQIIICTILLCLQIGPSALTGIAFFAVIIPVQAWTMQALLRVRLKSMAYTDSRSKILQELLGAMRIV